MKHDINLDQLIAQLPAFQDLSACMIGTIADSALLRRLSPGEVLFHRGDPPRGFFLVASGQVSLFFPAENGSEKVLQILGKGQTFGEASMFDDQPYPVSAMATADSIVICLDKTPIDRLLESDLQTARRMLAGMARRLHTLVRDIEMYSLSSGTERVIGYLMQLCADQGIALHESSAEIELPAMKQVIASRLNLTPESLSRIFHELAQCGLLQVEGRCIRIPDLAHLRSHGPQGPESIWRNACACPSNCRRSQNRSRRT